MNYDEQSPGPNQDPQIPLPLTDPQLRAAEIAEEIDFSWSLADNGVEEDPYEALSPEDYHAQIEADIDEAWATHDGAGRRKTPEELALRKRIFAAIVQRDVILGIAAPVDEDNPPSMPTAKQLRRFTNMSNLDIERGLAAISLEQLIKAKNSAAEIAAGPHTLGIDSRQKPAAQTPSDRLLARERAAAPKPTPTPKPPKAEAIFVPRPYTSWRDVSEAYRKGLSQHPFSYDPESYREDMGHYYHPELDEYPHVHRRVLGDSSIRQLEAGIINLEGIPRLEKGQKLKDLLSGLAPETPFLVFQDDLHVRAGRAGQERKSAKPRRLERQDALLLNLILLRSLRSGGEKVSDSWLQMSTGLPKGLLDTHMFDLMRKITGGSGVLEREQPGETAYYQMAKEALILDLRPPEPNSSE